VKYTFTASRVPEELGDDRNFNANDEQGASSRELASFSGEGHSPVRIELQESRRSIRFEVIFSSQQMAVW